MLRQLVKSQLVSRQLVKRPTGQIVEKIVTCQILNGPNLTLPLDTELYYIGEPAPSPSIHLAIRSRVLLSQLLVVMPIDF